MINIYKLHHCPSLLATQGFEPTTSQSQSGDANHSTIPPPAVWPPGSDDTVWPRPSVTLTFFRLTLNSNNNNKYFYRAPLYMPTESYRGAETDVQVASKVGNLHSKFGQARPLGSRIIRYIRDGRTDKRTDRWTDTNNTYCPLPTVGGITKGHNNMVNMPCSPIKIGPQLCTERRKP